MTTDALIVGVLGGAAGAAFINGLFRLAEQRRNRKAQKEDREEEKHDLNAAQSEDIRKLQKDMDAQKASQANMMAALREVLGAKRAAF